MPRATEVTYLGSNLARYLVSLILLAEGVHSSDSEREVADLTGRPCMTVERFRSAPKNTTFFECAPLGEEELGEYGITDKYLGTWHLRDCPKNHTFEERDQKCRDGRIMRAQPIPCLNDPLNDGCGYPCPLGNANPVVGVQCDIGTTTLQPDPASAAYFLQCAQQSPGQSCGEWIRIPCASGTVFDSPSSLCLPSALLPQADALSVCGPQAVPVCQCGQTVMGACPGVSSCRNNVCCLPSTAAPIGNFIQNQGAVYCPGTQIVAVPSCDGCTSSCIPNIGCCPTPTSTLCPNSLAPPIGQCSSCPPNYICNNAISSCCPSPSAQPSVTVVLLCPNGQPPSSACGTNGACPPGTGCYQGGCCPMGCPSGQQLIGFCNQGGCGVGTCYAPNGCCCQAEVIVLPICQNGVPSVVRCSVDSECGPTERCSNGGCCPMPFCPTGVQATLRCTTNAVCGPGMSCMDGACCPLPRCPSGLTAFATCTRTLDCGRPGVECANGGCCPLPQCPGGSFATQRCNDNSCCGAGFVCLNGGCCPLPQCPSGIIALSSCLVGTCPPGSECVNGGCCPLPQCPNGVLALQRCQIGVGCVPGNVCENGVCCPLPMCSAGLIATSACGIANSCPIGFVCEGRGCCPEPMPLCPNGGRASLRCIRGSECPPGYGCTPLGGCCLLSLEPVCPVLSTPICQCSPGQACPTFSTCNLGTCCSTGGPSLLVPGSTCSTSSQCNGYSNQYSQCVQNVCVCTNAVFFNVASRRRCVRNALEVSDPDSTCLPNEKCINGECKMKLWPGEYGCTDDEECSSRCPNTYCEKMKSDKNVPQCQCRDGLLLYGRCLPTCPKGFHESGATCVLDDEDAFWASAESQDHLKELLNKGQC